MEEKRQVQKHVWKWKRKKHNGSSERLQEELWDTERGVSFVWGELGSLHGKAGLEHERFSWVDSGG